MTLTDRLLASGFSFSRVLPGLITRPYETYRSLVDHGKREEVWWVFGVVTGYFALASLVRIASFRPFLLTQQFVLLLGGSVIGYLCMVEILYRVGTWIGGTGEKQTFAIAWAYTLIPTVCWFLMTSILYVLLPPPRTTEVMGMVFSGVYLTVSAVLFFWKAILAYLAIRFSLRLDFRRILVVVIVGIFYIGLFSLIMYRLNIFRVPFL